MDKPIIFVAYVSLMDGLTYGIKLTSCSIREKFIGTKWIYPPHKTFAKDSMLFCDGMWKNDQIEHRYGYLIGDIDPYQIKDIFYHMCAFTSGMPSEWKEEL